MKIFYNIVLATILLVCTQCSGKVKSHPETQDKNEIINESQTVALAPNKPIEVYVEFIKNKQQDPVDYILGLFEHNDIVILCERSHNEITQYELITNVIRDKRFIENVGHVFLEIGNINIQVFLEEFLMNNHLSSQEVDENLYHIIRNCSSSPVWEFTNYSDFVKDIYYLNTRLPAEEKVHLYPSNMPFSWEGMTKEKYEELKKKRTKVRDGIIAKQIIDKYNEILNSENTRKKALVIMNYRHAFPHLDVRIDTTEKYIKNVGGYLMEEYPGKVSNVMLNSVRVLFEGNLSWTVIQNGKWDAVFALSGNPDVGFDFRDSPFGKDTFDYFPYNHSYSYNDIFTGFVFYKSLEGHRMQYGHPGIFDEAFSQEFERKSRIKNEKITNDEIEEMIKELGKISEYGYQDSEGGEYENAKQLILEWVEKYEL